MAGSLISLIYYYSPATQKLAGFLIFSNQHSPYCSYKIIHIYAISGLTPVLITYFFTCVLTLCWQEKIVTINTEISFNTATST